jgi:hypothetical protein
MADQSDSEYATRLTPTRNNGALEDGDQLDAAGQTILKLVHKAAGVAEANRKHVLHDSAIELASGAPVRQVGRGKRPVLGVSRAPPCPSATGRPAAARALLQHCRVTGRSHASAMELSVWKVYPAQISELNEDSRIGAIANVRKK